MPNARGAAKPKPAAAKPKPRRLASGQSAYMHNLINAVEFARQADAILGCNNGKQCCGFGMGALRLARQNLGITARSRKGAVDQGNELAVRFGTQLREFFHVPPVRHNFFRCYLLRRKKHAK